MIEAILPNALQHRRAEGLVRLGREGDGGYVVARGDVERADLLISLGVNADWSFEKQFLALRNVPLFAYDASIGTFVFVRRSLAALLRPGRFRHFLQSISVLADYHRFFVGNRHHVAKFVGNKGGGDFVSLDEVFAANAADHLFLKIDVEGMEYRLLASILRHQDRLTGLVVEFHDCDLHMDKITRFADALNLSIVHINANNYAPVDELSRIPLILEISFSRNATPENEMQTYPSPNDTLNNPDGQGIALRFSGTG